MFCLFWFHGANRSVIGFWFHKLLFVVDFGTFEKYLLFNSCFSLVTIFSVSGPTCNGAKAEQPFLYGSKNTNRCQIHQIGSSYSELPDDRNESK